jgi:hypothetical protein
MADAQEKINLRKHRNGEDDYAKRTEWHPASLGRSSLAEVVLPAPFEAAMIMILLS